MRTNLQKKRKQFKYNYCSFFFMHLWERFCFCYCKHSEAVRNYRVYIEARDRLNKEQDLFNIIKQLRVNKLITKALFKPRQEKVAWTVSQENVISKSEVTMVKVHPWRE